MTIHKLVEAITLAIVYAENITAHPVSALPEKILCVLRTLDAQLISSLATAIGYMAITHSWHHPFAQRTDRHVIIPSLIIHGPPAVYV